ncbi:acetoacetate-CoA ligase [Aureobasidium pullulans]|uniref:Acetoacetate-CoA ligase n=1 Tax=Aureobasidium pullulans TaxID=5580 RepID=A0A4S9XK95_AURPU|nr:acetoacetate-CoA ligase [Aureobasidium pullulans]
MASPSIMPRKLWEHPNPDATNMAQFIRDVNKKRGLNMKTFQDLHKFSIDQRTDFWSDLFQLHPLIHTGSYTHVVDPNARMDSVPSWFSGVKLNFAENILYTADSRNPSIRTLAGKESEKVALTEVREGCTEIKHYTWKQLRSKVGLLAQAMKAHGVAKGDRVAVVASNSTDTLTVFLAVTTLGGIFSSSSTDMGSQGVLQRLTQIEPKWIFVDDWAVYNGKTIDLKPKMQEIVEGMRKSKAKGFQGVVSMPRFQEKPADVGDVAQTMSLAAFLSRAGGNSGLPFEKVDFKDPFLIVYSSGTTGVPKCIVHGCGPVLISSKKEGVLHVDSGPTTVNLQYTTTGWIMYLMSTMALQHGARSVLYDGSPFLPDLKAFIRLVGEQKVTDLGISPRYLQTLASASPPVIPKEVTDLSNLRRVSSTGMVLPESLFYWFYDSGFPPSVHLNNISGGTDVASSFAMGNLLTPLYAGGCQGPGLAMNLQVYDQTIEGGKGIKGKPLPIGEAGELVVTSAFPNQPVKFWGDTSGQKYFDAYYARFDSNSPSPSALTAQPLLISSTDVWTHGDYIFIHPKTGGVYFLGRADGVLNPSGVRFGSAEIYNVLETFFADDIQDSICVGQRRPSDNDESVMLFLLMKPGKKFHEQLVNEVKRRIGKECSPRHVPRFVFETKEIPTTVNLKKVELPVKRIVSGEKVTPSGTLLNPQSLEYYYKFAKVEELVGVKSKL